MDELAQRYPPRNAGALCLDFVNTLEPQAAAGQDRDHLGSDRLIADYPALLAWSVYAGVLTQPDARTLAARAAEDPRPARQAITAATRLRAALCAVFTAAATGRTADRAALDQVRDRYARAVAAAELQLGSPPARWTWPATGDPAAPLHPIAASAIELLTGPRLRHVKQCAGQRCWVLFVDETKNQSRRWCQMRYCGNVLKGRRQAAERRRARAAALTTRQ